MGPRPSVNTVDVSYLNVFLYAIAQLNTLQHIKHPLSNTVTATLAPLAKVRHANNNCVYQAPVHTDYKDS